MVIAAIVAGGTGTRMGHTSMPKQFLDCEGVPIIIRTMDVFLRCRCIDKVAIGIHPDWEKHLKMLIDSYFASEKDRIMIAIGGNDRNSTISGIISAVSEAGYPEDSVIVSHDAVRPFVSEELIRKSIEALTEYDVCTASVPSTDTVAVSEDGRVITGMPARSSIYRLQTPQTFRMKDFEDAYASLSDGDKHALTDVCGLFLKKNYRIGMVEGNVSNIKITYPQDLQVTKHV